MSMQDKEMDELFRAKLDNLEIQPSDKVWKGIVVELDGNKRKRSLVPVLRIAAGITVFIAVGLFFMLKGNKPVDNQIANQTGVKQQRIKLSAKGENTNEDGNEENVLQPKQNNQQIAAEVEQQETEHDKIANAIGRKKDNRINDVVATGNKLAVANNSKHHTGKIVQPSAIEVKEIEQERSTPVEQQTLAALPEKEIKPIQAVVPDEPLNVDKPAIPGVDDFKTTNKVASVPLPAIKPAKVAAKKHGIRSFGDLINVVVAKVDKRQDKVIHFSDTDDDESNITGINLGFVKVKKEEK
ncbi:hypothetical protein [Mucilaginibacter jinjuensis]|uniref:Uncharacterized protein n=1 Tax=Mucilaginibacter jinjuensis TaxID=1176721 RepID=A0ABY7T520_9SPHI|nr:hypothetical protein [Mucilaginibacter jinjuensis]WCT11338.1 hypothetical protein PQO05_21605 [Mucilaginibacter jinjuensis]